MNKNESNKLRLAYAQWTYDNNFEETKLCIEKISKFVDYTIIVYDEPINPKNLEWIDKHNIKYNIHLVRHEFVDNFPEARNQYIKRAKELKVDWLCVSDPDELFSEELSKNLRALIEKYDSEGCNNIAVPVRDQFDAIEWLDKLDKLKECPAGYRETDFWKPMLIFKLFDDIHYEGVGIEKNVHETLATKWKMVTVNLPKEYYYVHKKSSLKIRRNAARNLFISGGGDNVGSKNHLWMELRQLCSKIGINKWEEFEDFVELGIDRYLNSYYRTSSHTETDTTKKDKIKDEFRLWLESALKAHPTKEGTETRECAKWYFSQHKDEIDKRIQDLIDKVPELSEEIEIENFVTQMYYKVLGRHPDEAGKSDYVKKIMKGTLKRADFITELQNSKEHKERFGSTIVNNFDIRAVNGADISEYDKEKYCKVEDFVTRTYVKILGREPDDAGKRYYTKAIMDRIIKPSDIPEIFRSSDEYRMKKTHISGVKNSRKPNKISMISKKLNLKSENIGSSKSSDTIALCIMGYHDCISMIKESIRIMHNYVNEIHVQGDNFTEEDIKELKDIDNRTQIHVEPWIDDFSDYKNKAISHAETEWALICYDSETEILTSHGFKKFPDITKEDEVVTLNPDNENIEYHHPLEAHHYEYEGKMLRLEGKHYDLLITPNHSMYARKRDNYIGNTPKFKFYTASKLSEFSGFAIKKTGTWIGKDKQIISDIPNDIFMPILGWYVSEGCSDIVKLSNGGEGYRITIHNSNEEYRQEISSLIEEIGRSPIIDGKTGITFYHREMWEYLHKLGGHSWEKYIPEEVKKLPKEQLLKFLDTYVKGDGKSYETNEKMTTTSKKLSDDLQEIILKCGFSSTISEYEPREGGYNDRGIRIVGKHKLYVISTNHYQLEPEIRKGRGCLSYFEEVNYKGTVHDVTIPNHIIFVRRNGKVMFCGNCDHDEIPTEEMAKEIPKIINSSDRGNNYDMVSFDVIDTKTVNGREVSDVRNRGGKPLLHWNIPNPYVGNPHIWLKQGYYPWKEIHNNTAYKHVKENGTELERSVRNIFLGGGGDNSKERNLNWIELRKVSNDLGITTYKQFDEYLKKGSINKKLLDVIINLNEMNWKDDELKDILKYYLLLHPEEKEYVENKEYRQKKFGDNISWEEHVNEVLKEKQIYYPYNPDWDRVKMLQKYKQTGKLLDAGCNIGRYINTLKGAGYNYTGIDQSQYAIDTAKENNPNDKFFQNFLWNIKFENEFDIIFMKAVLQHNQMNEKKRIIPQLFKALKNGGIFLMDESTLLENTETQLTHDNWINLVESFGFKFKESFHKNELDVDDCYVFEKPN